MNEKDNRDLFDGIIDDNSTTNVGSVDYGQGNPQVNYSIPNGTYNTPVVPIDNGNSSDVFSTNSNGMSSIPSVDSSSEVIGFDSVIDSSSSVETPVMPQGYVYQESPAAQNISVQSDYNINMIQDEPSVVAPVYQEAAATETSYVSPFDPTNNSSEVIGFDSQLSETNPSVSVAVPVEVPQGQTYQENQVASDSAFQYDFNFNGQMKPEIPQESITPSVEVIGASPQTFVTDSVESVETIDFDSSPEVVSSIETPQAIIYPESVATETNYVSPFEPVNNASEVIGFDSQIMESAPEVISYETPVTMLDQATGAAKPEFQIHEGVALPQMGMNDALNMAGAMPAYTGSLDLTQTALNNDVQPEILNVPNDNFTNNGNMIQPNLINNPIVSEISLNQQVEVEEPRKDYNKITQKKNFVFMGILFGLLVIFVILLPWIAGLFR